MKEFYDLFSIDKKGKVEDEMKERIGSKKYINGLFS